MIEKIKPLLTILVLVLILALVAMTSAGCHSTKPKIGKILAYDVVCVNVAECHDKIDDECEQYEVFRQKTVENMVEVRYSCLDDI